MPSNSPLLLALVLTAAPATATDWVVAPTGGDFTSIQAALDVAVAGDRVLVREKLGGWAERLVFPRSGNAMQGFIELAAYPGESPELTGAGLGGEWMVAILDRSYIRVRDLVLRDNLASGDGSGVRVQGAGRSIEIQGCTFRDLTGSDSMAITVYGTAATPIEDLRIAGNLVHDCTPAHSETITLNGNVRNFVVEDNVVRDVNNIGIDFIGGESSIHPTQVARQGVCRRNYVARANSSYGGGFAAGIYVDGGRDILIEDNVVVGSDMGIEIGAENSGFTVTGVVVRRNLLVANEKAGLVLGGYDSSVGRVRDSAFVHNLCYRNTSHPQRIAELWVQWADDCSIAGNVFVAGPSNALVYEDDSTTGFAVDRNLWHGPGGAGGIDFEWGGAYYGSFATWRAGTGFDPLGRFGAPRFVDPTGLDGLLGTLDDDFRLQAGSPAIDLGDARLHGPTSSLAADGSPRFVEDPASADVGSGARPRPDAGPHEFEPSGTRAWRHCTSGANSAGDGAWMGFDGSLSVAANDLLLEARDAAPGQPAIFFYGPGTADLPFGDGRLCVGGGFFRLGVVSLDAAGAASRPVDLASPPGVAGQVTPGSSWSWQLWYRDPAAAGSGYNLSDGLRIRFGS